MRLSFIQRLLLPSKWSWFTD